MAESSGAYSTFRDFRDDKPQPVSSNRCPSRHVPGPTKSEDNTTILIIIDSFSKMAHLVALPKLPSAKETTKELGLPGTQNKEETLEEISVVEAWLKDRPWVSHFVPYLVEVRDRLKKYSNPPAPSTNLYAGSRLSLGGPRSLQKMSVMGGRVHSRNPSPLQPAHRHQPPAPSADGTWEDGGLLVNPAASKRHLVWVVDIGEGASTAGASLFSSLLTGTSYLQS
ncbi:unnamed protein product [Pleuronectes platessa]|uniref:Uncharacterized protein n=1 Tax=Pleuronectes platessa TaxID=8262 RepID=A0A9N7U6S4_PLEPL|nr:unnamed protein product [Pleuronectes platessa]